MPVESTDSTVLLARMRDALHRAQYQRSVVNRYVLFARQFLDYLADSGIRVEDIEPHHVEMFLRRELRRYRRRHGHAPTSMRGWRSLYTVAIHQLLRMVRGSWPPVPAQGPDWLLARMRDALTASGYRPTVIDRYLVYAKLFLRYIAEANLRLEEVEPRHVEAYLSVALRRYRRIHGCAPRVMVAWRCSHTAGIHQLLRFARGRWPGAPAISTPEDTWREALCGEFEQWLREWRGLARTSTVAYVDEARRFLSWYVATRVSVANLNDLGLSDIDGFLKGRCQPLRRVSRKNVTHNLRCFLRFLHATGHIERDLASGVISPTLYALESIPSALAPDQIAAVLASVRRDRSAAGLRDHAILTLLATYGLRAGEVTTLRLDDVDWRADRLWIRHTKTDARSCLPLVPAVGDALLDYLRHGRPAAAAREIFVHIKAPFSPLARGSSLYLMVRRRLEAAGVKPAGKKGPHTFRHARAVSLLRGAVSTKAIGDLLGHRSVASTAPYLKLASDDLRAVALELPAREVRP